MRAPMDAGARTCAILIAAAETGLRAQLARAFEAEGFTVDTAGDGDDVLSRCRTADYGLVILDLTLPGRDSLAVLSELHGQLPELPVVILSDRGDLVIKLRSFELGAVDFLAKPFPLEELLARSRVQLRRGPAVQEAFPVLRAGRLELELTGHRARCGDHSVNLSDREFALLHFLMTHADEVVSRERLLSEVWKRGVLPRSNVVDVCVRRLRRRLGPEAPIQTVRRAGYRVAPSHALDQAG